MFPVLPTSPENEVSAHRFLLSFVYLFLCPKYSASVQRHSWKIFMDAASEATLRKHTSSSPSSSSRTRTREPLQQRGGDRCLLLGVLLFVFHQLMQYRSPLILHSRRAPCEDRTDWPWIKRLARGRTPCRWSPARTKSSTLKTFAETGTTFFPSFPHHHLQHGTSGNIHEKCLQLKVSRRGHR